LFLASALTLNDDPTTPADQVRDMVDYAGTTAAGLTNMMASPLSHAISEGLLVAAAKARTI
jgi:pyrroline-5-carboxylate reductase